MKQKEFKEMCIRLGFVDSNLKIDYQRVRTLMAIGQIHMVNECDMEEYPALHKQMWSDYEIIREYKEC